MKNSLIEENPFKIKQIAEEWISIVENNERESTSRKDFVYPLLEKTVNELKPRMILEIGSGQGICSSKIGNNFGMYTGVEPSEFLVEHAVKKYGDKKRVFAVGDAYELPLVTASVDFAFSIMAWFHIQNISKASREMSRVLKKGGKFLIVTAHPNMYSVWQTFFDDPEVDDEKIVGKINTPTGSMVKNIIYKYPLDSILSELGNNAELFVESTEGFGYGEKYGDCGLFILIEGIKQ